MSNQQVKFNFDENSFEAYVKNRRNIAHPIALLLDRLENFRNVANCFRLADAANLAHIFGFQMEPFLEHKKFRRITRSTERFIPYTSIDSLDAIKELKTGFHFIALERTDQSIDYRAVEVPANSLIILGNEVNGVSKELLSLADQTIHLPMYGVNSSMNAGMAAGIAIYKLLEVYHRVKESDHPDP